MQGWNGKALRTVEGGLMNFHSRASPGERRAALTRCRRTRHISDNGSLRRYLYGGFTNARF